MMLRPFVYLARQARWHVLRSGKTGQRLAETLIERKRGIAGETSQRRLRLDDAVTQLGSSYDYYNPISARSSSRHS